MVTTSSNKGFSVPTVGGDAGVWGGELNNTINFADTILGGSITFNASAAATVTLAASQAQYNRVVFTGTPASSMVLNIMSSTILGGYGNFDIWNNTSTSANGGAGFNIACQVCSTSTGTTVSIPVANMRLINVDGQNVQLADQVVIPTTVLPPVLNGYISGLILSNDATTPNTVLDITAGVATDSSAVSYIQSAAAFTKATSGAWVVGSGNTGMGTGLTFSANTTYHVFIISNGTSSNIDFYYDTSATAANKPANTNFFRRIGSMLATSSAAVWRQFGQTYDTFHWSAPVFDVNTVTFSGTTSSPTTVTLTVPTGINVRPLAFVGNTAAAGVGSYTCYIWGINVVSSDVTLNAGVGFVGRSLGSGVTGLGGGWVIEEYTNTSAQLFGAGGGGTTSIQTFGWVDPRGK